MGFLKRIPWWAWAAAFVAVVFLVNSVSGNVFSRKLWNMVADQIREDQSRVVKVLEDNMKTYEAEISRLQSEVAAVHEQQAVAKAESERLRGLVREKDNEIMALRRVPVVVPSDPNALADEFRQRGYRPRLDLSPR